VVEKRNFFFFTQKHENPRYASRHSPCQSIANTPILLANHQNVKSHYMLGFAVHLKEARNSFFDLGVYGMKITHI